MLGDQQVSGAGDGQKLGDAFDNPEQDDLQEIFHVRFRVALVRANNSRKRLRLSSGLTRNRLA
jgi:hypothetical protein